jgi:hypothetical protein
MNNLIAGSVLLFAASRLWLTLISARDRPGWVDAMLVTLCVTLAGCGLLALMADVRLPGLR